MLRLIFIAPLAWLLFGALSGATASGGEWFADGWRVLKSRSGLERAIGRDAFADAMAAVQKIPEAVSDGAVAARVTGQGHWTFVNRAGQHFTAANKAEMARVGPILFPESAEPLALTVYLTETAVFLYRDQLGALPANARLRLVIGERNYRLAVRKAGDGSASPGLVAAVRRDVLVPLVDLDVFREVVWQLERPLTAAGYRILALINGGPAALGADRRRKLKDGVAPVIEQIDPGHLTNAVAGLRGQLAILTGRIDGDKLVVRDSSGFEASLDLRGLLQAAAANDAGLAILNSKAPRQPGQRNWLWQTVDVDGLAAALKRDTVADFLGSLALAGGNVEVRRAVIEGDRVSLDVVAVSEGLLAPSSESIVGWIAELASEVVGTVVTSAVRLDLVRSGRVRELDRRIVPGLPSLVQGGFVILVILGLLVLPVALMWWRRIWPAEERGEYAGWFGLMAARAVRWLAFGLIFLPLASAPALVWLVGRMLGLVGRRAGLREGEAAN